MSLLVWLPLNKDLRNNGLSNFAITNSGATLDNNGKLGKCYSFNGNNNYLLFNYGLPKVTTTWSYCCWAKLVNNNTTMCLYSQREAVTSDQRTIFIVYGKVFYYDDGVRVQGSLNTSADLTRWNHYAFIRNGNSLKIYINGIETVSTSISATPSTVSSYTMIGASQNTSTSPSGNSLYGYLNDVRIYNHALSAKEIDILSRGLVVHYPLNNNTGGQSNLFDFESIASKWVASGTTMSNYTDSIYGNVLKVSTGSSLSGETRIYRNVSNIWTSGQVYTVSFMAKASKTTTVKASRSLADYASDFTVGTEWKRYSGKISCTATVTAGTLSIQNYTTSSDLYITQIKLELGDKVTAYQPGVGDSKYNPLGYNDNIEYDASGYGNNMTKTGTITYIPDSARYSVSSHFINGSYLMANQNSTEYLPKDSLTVNLWVKPTTWANPISCTESGGWNFEGSPVQFPCYISGVGYKVAASNVTGASLQDGKWHMLTGTYDSIAQEVKIYVDGVLKTTTATGSSNNIGYASNRLIISGEAGGGTSVASSSYVGEESDVRIYATALTADQVLDLYKSSASVANNGTLIGYEFIEN